MNWAKHELAPIHLIESPYFIKTFFYLWIIILLASKKQEFKWKFSFPCERWTSIFSQSNPFLISWKWLFSPTIQIYLQKKSENACQIAYYLTKCEEKNKEVNHFILNLFKENPFSKWIIFILYEFTLNFICNWNEKNKTKIQTIQNTKENCWNSVNGIIFVCFFCMILFIFIQAFANNKIRTNFAQHFKLNAFLYMNHWWIALNSLLLHLNPFDFPKTSTFEPLHASFHQTWWIDIENSTKVCFHITNWQSVRRKTINRVDLI